MNVAACLLEIFGKLSAAELSGLCQFIMSKVDLLDREIDKLQVYGGFFENQINIIENQIRQGENIFDQYVTNSPLLGVVQSLSPNCAPAAQIFQGLFEYTGNARAIVDDSVMIGRQLATGRGLIQTAINKAKETTSFLRDICTILQLAITQATTNKQIFGTGIQPHSLLNL